MPRGAARAVNAANGGVLRLRSALTVTAPLSVARGGGRDEGRPSEDFDGLRRVEQRAGGKKEISGAPLDRRATVVLGDSPYSQIRHDAK
jgi:hypothetical protein